MQKLSCVEWLAGGLFGGQTVIASEAKQSSFGAAKKAGLLRRFAP
jgi:hypothetical protein